MTRFVHDELDQLVAVVADDGERALPRYDTFGNLEHVARDHDVAPVILAVIPRAAQVGQTVRVRGVGFSASPADHLVRVGSTSLQVVAASPTELEIVAARSTSGPLHVEVAGASVATSFDVLIDAPVEPRIDSIEPAIVEPGATVRVSGVGLASALVPPRVSVNGVAARVVESGAAR